MSSGNIRWMDRMVHTMSIPSIGGGSTVKTRNSKLSYSAYAPAGPPPSSGRAAVPAAASPGAAFCFDLYTMSKIERRAPQP